MPHAECDPRLLRLLEDLIGGFQRVRQRLFHEDVAPRARGRYGMFGVQVRRAAHPHGVSTLPQRR